MHVLHVLRLLLILRCVRSERIDNVQDVLNDVLATTRYNKMIRGQLDLQQKTTVNVDFALLNILKLNEVEGWIEVMGVIYVSWTDERLVWNPDHYNGTKQVS